MITLNKNDIQNVLILIDRAIKASPLPGGLNDLKAVTDLAIKLDEALHKENGNGN